MPEDDRKRRIAQMLMQPEQPTPYEKTLGGYRVKEAMTGHSILGDAPGSPTIDPLAASPLRWLGTLIGQLAKLPPEEVEARMRQQMQEAQMMSDQVPRGPF